MADHAEFRGNMDESNRLARLALDVHGQEVRCRRSANAGYDLTSGMEPIGSDPQSG